MAAVVQFPVSYNQSPPVTEMATVVLAPASYDQTPPVAEMNTAMLSLADHDQAQPDAERATVVVSPAGYDQTPPVTEMASVMLCPASYSEMPPVVQVAGNMQCPAGYWATYKQQRLGKHLPYVARVMTHRHLGRGPHPQTLHVGNTYVALQHPITNADLPKPRKSEPDEGKSDTSNSEENKAKEKMFKQFSSTELHAILAYLEQAVRTRGQQLHYISPREIEIHFDRSKTCDMLKLYLGSEPPDTAELPVVKDILEPTFYPTREKRRCVKVGNCHGGETDHISLPDSLGEYMVFNPLIPDDVLASLAGLDREKRCLAILEILKALMRRSHITQMQEDYDKFGPLQTARSHSIQALWFAYRAQLEENIHEEILEFVEESTKDFVQSCDETAGLSMDNKKFFMLPSKTGPGGLTFRLRSGDAPLSDENIPTDDDAPANDISSADAIYNDSNVARSIAASRTSSLLRLPPSAPRSPTTTVSSWRPYSDASLEQFPAYVDPFQAHDDTIAAEMLQPNLTPVQSDLSVISIKPESKQPTPLTSIHDLHMTSEVAGDIKPSDEEEDKGVDGFPNLTLSRTIGWFKGGHATTSGENANRPAHLQGRSVLTKPRPSLKPENRSKSESWLPKVRNIAKLKNLFGKKKDKKSEKGKERMSDMSATSNTHLLRSVTAENVDEFLHPGGETSDGVQVPANTIAEPRTSVADSVMQVSDGLVSTHQLPPPPSRYPPVFHGRSSTAHLCFQNLPSMLKGKSARTKPPLEIST
jgi:hypothetical protein